MSTETNSAPVVKGANLVGKAENAQPAAGAKLEDAFRLAAANNFPKEKSPFEICREVAPGLFLQTGESADLEDSVFFLVVAKITQPSGEQRT